MNQENSQRGCCQNIDNNSFLIYFEIKEKAQSFIGLPLVYGVRIISFFCIIISLLEIFDTNIDFISFLVAFIEGTSYFLILMSSFNNDTKIANYGYFIICIYYWITAVLLSLIALLILVYFQNIPLFLIFVLIVFGYMCFKTYINWIIYSYIQQLKNENINSQQTNDNTSNIRNNETGHDQNINRNSVNTNNNINNNP